MRASARSPLRRGTRIRSASQLPSVSGQIAPGDVSQPVERYLVELDGGAAAGVAGPRVHHRVGLAHRVLALEQRHTEHPARLAVDEHQEFGGRELGRERACVECGAEPLEPCVDVGWITVEPRHARPHALLPSVGFHWAGPGAGIAPSCCIIPSASKTPQCSWARPSSPKRMMSISCTSTLLPVAGMPMNSPWCVPVVRTRATTLSPSTSTSSASMRRSGNAARYILNISITPALLRSKPGVSSCSTKSSAACSPNPSTSPALINSYRRLIVAAWSIGSPLSGLCRREQRAERLCEVGCCDRVV